MVLESNICTYPKFQTRYVVYVQRILTLSFSQNCLTQQHERKTTEQKDVKSIPLID